MPRGTAPSASQIKEYKALIRNVVNPRLKRLEIQAQKSGQGNLTSFAYRKIGIEGSRLGIINITERGGIRVSTAIPSTARQLDRRMALLREFQEMPTSTVTGYRTVAQNRLDSFNRTMRKSFRGKWTDMSLAEFEEFWGEVNAGNLDAEFYKSHLKVLNKMRSRDDKSAALREQVEAFKKRQETSKKASAAQEIALRKALISSGMKSSELAGLPLKALAKIASNFI